MDGCMYCPQCGKLIEEDAVACHNCGTLLNDTNTSTVNSGFRNVSGLKPVLRISKVSLWMGILAVFPYLLSIFAMLYSELFPTTPITSDWVRLLLRITIYPSILGIISGFPFGLAAIISGIIGYIKQPKIQKNVVTALIGIVLGIGGFVGHIWYIWIFATCQFCQ